MSKKGNIVIIALVAIAIIGGAIFFSDGDLMKIGIKKGQSRSSQASLVQDHLVKIAELATLRYEYKNVIVSLMDKSILLPVVPDIKYAEAIRLIEYTGYLKAGTDFSDIRVEYTSEPERLLVVLPHSRILDNVVETESVVVQDIKKTIFLNYPTQAVFEEINNNKKALEAEKIAQGFLREADKRIEEIMKSFLKMDGIEEVEIIFKD